MSESLKKLSIDLYNNKNMMYNEVSGDVAMRRIFNEALGQEQDATRIEYYKYQDNKNKLFQIISVAVDAVVPVSIKNQFDSLADVQNVQAGDKPRFTIEDPSLFKVSMVAAGTRDMGRQEMHGRSFTLDTDWYGVKTFAELNRFLAGEVNWKGYIDKVAESFVQKMGQQIIDGFMKAYDGIKANRKATGTYDEDQLLELARHVKTQSGKNVAVYGSANALRKVTRGLQLSDGMREEANRVGYLGRAAGLDLITLPDVYKAANVEEFAIDDNTLIVLPQGEKIISIVMEGDSIVHEVAATERNDMQMEFETLKQYGLSVAQLAVFGMYKITN